MAIGDGLNGQAAARLSLNTASFATNARLTGKGRPA